MKTNNETLITKENLEAVIVFLFKIEQYEACEAMLNVAKFIQQSEGPNWAVLIKPNEDILH